MHKRTVVITLFLGFSLCHTLYYVTTTFFQLPKKRILNNIRNASFTLRSNYFRKYNTITLCIGSSFLDFIFELHCDILLLRHNYVIDLFKGVLFWWPQHYVELWKLLENMKCVCKSRYKMVIFKLVIYVLAHQLFDNVDILDYVKNMFLVVFLH